MTEHWVFFYIYYYHTLKIFRFHCRSDLFLNNMEKYKSHICIVHMDDDDDIMETSNEEEAQPNSSDANKRDHQGSGQTTIKSSNLQLESPSA